MISALLASVLAAPASADLAFKQLESAASAGFSVPAVQGKPRPHAGILKKILGGGADRDNDGLADDAEAELAAQFAPELHFDDRENATRPGEPVTLYQVRPLGCSGTKKQCGGADLTVRIVYTHLWEYDGGYGPESRFCRNPHIGDAQAVSVTVSSSDDGATFDAKEVAIGEFTWPKDSASWTGAHFNLLPSAGKHHFFFDKSWNGKVSPYSKWNCRDSVNGAGYVVTASLAANVGEPEAHDPVYFAGELTMWGFPGEEAWDTRKFCGGIKCDRKTNETSPLVSMWSKDPFTLPKKP
jgi:hypothetical protein